MTDRLLPNWIKAYLAYTNEQESPDNYHIWVALSTIAGVLRRKVFFPMGYFLYYPNMYVVLIGPPGRCKKSTAMRIGRGLGSLVPGVDFSVDSTTRERMIQDMSQSFKDGMSALTVHSTEFASIITSSGMDMVNFLTDVFDCPPSWTHKTKGGGTNTIKAPYLNLLGATTPDWLARGLPLDTVGIGFTSRVVFIYADTPRVRDPFPKLSPEQIALQELLLKDLASMANLSGEFKFDETADALFRDFYKSHLISPNPTGDPRLAGYYERKPTHLIKLCMIISASKSDSLIITGQDYAQAYDLLLKAEDDMPKVFASIGRNPLFADQEAAFAAFLNREDGFSVGELMERFGYNVRLEEMQEIVNTLVTKNKIIQRGARFYVNREAGRVPGTSEANKQ